MIKSDLVEILSALKTAEQERLFDFIRSPYCNPKAPVAEQLKLAEVIFQSLNLGQPQMLNREYLYAAVFPNQAFVFNKLEKLASATLKCVRLFMQYELLNQGKPALALFLQGEFLRRKNLHAAFRKTQEKIREWQSTTTKWAYDEYALNWLIEISRNCFECMVTDKKGDQNLFATMKALNALHTSQSAYYTSILLNLHQSTPLLTETQVNDLLSAHQQLKASAFFQEPLGQLFEKSIVFLANLPESESIFEDFCNLLEQQQGNLADEYLINFEVYAVNFCVRNFTRNPKYPKRLFDLLQKRVQAGRIYTENKITASEFQNIVKVGLLQKEFSWVWEFMQANRDKIAGSQNPEEYYRFNMAMYWFATGEFDNALQVLLTADYKEMQYKFSSKVLEIKILYEQESEVLPARIDAAKIYFYREQKIPADKKEMYCNFVDFMRRLIRPQTPVDLKRIEKLHAELHANTNMAEWFWLNEKLEAMLPKGHKKSA